MKLHTILGAGGSVANELLAVLTSHHENIRLVSRNVKPVDGVETVRADITDYKQALQAVENSSVVYLLTGLKYDVRVWAEKWPVIMTNVINACRESGAKLIFFDNVYMYGKVDGVMTEQTPFNPVSRKGEIRALIATKLLDEIANKNITALIARSADFYGPVGFSTSVANLLVFKNFKKRKHAQWLGNPNVPHSFTYVPDAARALYMLANSEDAFGQTWHLPTAPHPLTGEEFIHQAATAMQADSSYNKLSGWLVWIGGLFDRTIKELQEMLYQNEYPYIFDSTKFDTAFHFEPTSYKNGIIETAIWTLRQ
ncbi:NAD-dependent epimerase/dehydratase family protein [Danxiaibacter flavus]|uniref:NAD-dependent epimerase/dehydratase family protein n=1 Tax=Danxiaibacter flavus TaxID=3049108 RepID=A0ABV3ZFK5_9BACT|nr:NAD-dependent epimerase/dehydratase family protein [Chitinophagaceae bacterium DXS]